MAEWKCYELPYFLHCLGILGSMGIIRMVNALPKLLPLVRIRKYVSERSALSPREARYETAPTFVSKLL